MLPALTILPYDTGTARVFGELSATLEQSGTPLADADLQIAAIIQHPTDCLWDRPHLLESLCYLWHSVELRNRGQRDSKNCQEA